MSRPGTNPSCSSETNESSTFFILETGIFAYIL